MNTTPSGHTLEKRQHERHEFLQATFFRLDKPKSKPSTCTVVNLSFGGLMMRTTVRLAAGEHILIILNLDGLVLTEKATVVHAAERSSGNAYGCRFTDDATRELRHREINNYLQEEA